jgi:dCTP deaminase
MINSFGALPDHMIEQCIREKIIMNSSQESIPPSSLDLTIDLSSLVEVPYVFLPSKKKSKIEETLHHLEVKKIKKNSDGYLIKKGKVYIARIKEEVRLPADLFAYANPKSSTGRSDVHSQLIGDFITQYDRIPKSWSGDLYVIIRSHSFNVLFLDDQVSLNQLRLFFHKNGILSDVEIIDLARKKAILKNEYKKTNLIFSDFITENRIELSLDLRDWGTDDDCLGFIAKKGVKKPLVWKAQENRSEDFFEPIQKVRDDRAFRLEKNRFYILSSRESVYVPRELACEMLSFNDLHGEFRVHYAGFIDNGWGEKGHRPLTLEVRPHENLLAYHGQPVSSLVFYRMFEEVERGYDEIVTSNYKNQKAAKLGKFFV